MTYNQLEVCLSIIDEAIDLLEEKELEEAHEALLVARDRLWEMISPAEENPLDFDRVMSGMLVAYPSEGEADYSDDVSSAFMDGDAAGQWLKEHGP